MTAQLVHFLILFWGLTSNMECSRLKREKEESIWKYCKEEVDHGHHTLNCSHQSLKYIPRIKDKIDTLIFSFNHLTNISQETFVNISYPSLIYALYIDNNSVTSISSNALDVFPNLHLLFLSYNQIYYDNLKHLIGSLSEKRYLMHLEISAISTVILNEDLFSLIKENHIKTLVATNYFTETLDMRIFKNFNRLETLDISYNHISNVILSKNKYLRSLYISRNTLRTLPDFRINGNESNCFFPQLDFLNVKDNDIQEIKSEHLKCLNRLRVLNLNGNIISVLPNNFLSALLNIQTVQIMLPGTRSLIVEPFAFNSSSLKSLSLQYRFSALYVFQSLNQTFKLLPKLIDLKIIGISMSQLSNKDIIGLFSPLNYLEKLHCFHCLISWDPKLILNLMKHLKTVDLRSNMISKLSSETFKDKKNLRKLDLRYNQLGHIDSTALPISLLNKLDYLDISKNPFVCDCNLEWFIAWLQSTHKPGTILRYPKEYICNLPKEKTRRRLSDVSFTYRECHPWNTWIWVAIIASPCVIVICIIIIVVYRNRWNIKHYIYLMRKRRNYQVIEGNDFVYDAFVGYESEDSVWVRRRLLPVLEEEIGLKLCIHERDFQPGVFINDNIVTNMDKSRKVILVLTNAFARSGWCMFELKIAHSKQIEDETELVVILLEKIDGRNMNHSLKCLFDSTTYIEWTEDLVGQELFWEQLKTVLVKI
ncbi:toll-like receptor 13 [Ruditapes philippinarum]|uniref:toll-like receptor 13 n=1 Tax=Ruditapes philippinarum TaxID=129788 RepID=UPI00295B6247|nr:toll-like receptor 13 [Ruditapes philippinarum]XP_060561168.1 toll-like receptor 13 [Ruditapes philippinarum]